MLGAIDRVLSLDRRLRVSTSPLVDVNHRAGRNGQFEWGSLYNHSGQLGNALHGPIPISSVRISFQPAKPVRSARSLATNQELEIVDEANNRIAVILRELKHHDVVLFEY